MNKLKWENNKTVGLIENYRVSMDNEGDYWWRLGRNKGHFGAEATIEEAKQACQKHYDNEIKMKNGSVIKFNDGEPLKGLNMSYEFEVKRLRKELNKIKRDMNTQFKYIKKLEDTHLLVAQCATRNMDIPGKVLNFWTNLATKRIKDANSVIANDFEDTKKDIAPGPETVIEIIRDEAEKNVNHIVSKQLEEVSKVKTDEKD